MAQLPQFFHPASIEENSTIALDEAAAKHICLVLRKKQGDKILLTDGAGRSAIAVITSIDKKKCGVLVESVALNTDFRVPLHLCVAFTKNPGRNEWLLEKATELGVSNIIPVLTARTERTKINYERWRNIMVSALLQSQQYYLPQLHEAKTLDKVINSYRNISQKLVAHCIEGKIRLPLSKSLKSGEETVIMIGPEGDFSQDEVNLCLANDFLPVSMGSQRLRTETAAITACAYFSLINDKEE